VIRGCHLSLIHSYDYGSITHQYSSANGVLASTAMKA